MKKLLVASLLLAVCSGSAWAQSSVTLYGVLDVGITYVSNQHGHSVVGEDTGIVQANRWGFRGVEDLGGGNQAIFVLESGVALNNGTLGQGGALFGRTASLGLSNKFGTFTFGRQFDFFTYNIALDSAGGQFGGGYAMHPFDIDRLAGEQFNNTVKYVSPTIAGFTVGALYGFSNVAGNFAGTAGSPRATSFGLTYTGDALFVGIAYADTNGTGDAAAKTLLNATAIRNYGIGARYLLGSVTFFGNYTNNRISGVVHGGSSTLQNFEAGANWFALPYLSVGLGYTFTDWSKANFNQVNAGIHYFLSKRTDVYATASYEHSNSQAQTPAIWLTLGTTGYSSTQNQVAVRVGIRTKF